LKDFSERQPPLCLYNIRSFCKEYAVKSACRISGIWKTMTFLTHDASAYYRYATACVSFL